MNIKFCYIKKAALFLIVISLTMFLSGPTFAEQCQIIRLDKSFAGGGTDIEIVPHMITVPQGTCTVWINFVRDMDLQVSFKENAKSCMQATQAKAGFKIMESSDFEMVELETGQSCYLSRSIPFGKSSNLTWSEPGEYKYTVEAIWAKPTALDNAPLGEVTAKGTIIVKETENYKLDAPTTKED